MAIYGFEDLYPSLGKWLALVILLTIWKLIWYGVALYKTLEKKDRTWFIVLFVCAFVLNDLGILPIIYLLIHRKKHRR